MKTQNFQVQKRLNSLYEEKRKLEEEIALLEKQLLPNKTLNKDEKIKLFKALFIPRDDVFLRKWISKDKSKSSYFPVTKTFKGEDYIPLSNKEIELHLRGETKLATYLVNSNNLCKYALLKISLENKKSLLNFLKEKNINAYLEIDENLDLVVWFFFEELILAKTAKMFLQNIVKDCNISAKLYPNVDFVNAGNLGFYKELPLHLKERENNKTIFCELENEKVIFDQWDFLLQIKKISKQEVQKLAKEFETKEVKSWEDSAIEKVKYPDFNLDIVLYDFFYVPLENLSKSFLKELKALASFENPQVKLLLNLRKPLYNIPKFIRNFEEEEKYLKLPRGVLNAFIKICKKNNIKFTLDDKRVYIKASFPKVKYKLREEQNQAIEKIIKKDFSICVAPPGFGKTLIGSKMIELRASNTLVLVNKNMLLDQWIQRFVDYFEMEKKDIGFLGKGKNKLNSKLDIATMQSLKNQPELIKNYSFIIVDECHHIPAVTFELIIKQFCGKYLLGLSATPNRKDGLEPILFQQLGNISYEYKKKRTHTHKLKIINSDFSSEGDNYASLINELILDETRNNLILEQIKLHQDRKVLVLTDRIEHINILEQLLIKNNLNYVSIHGSMSKKEKDENLDKIEAYSLILATSSYFGEGIDFPHLNTIVFTTPISYYGRLVQYLGRVGRNNQECLAIDIVDKKNAMLNSSFKKRLEGYKQMHYKIH